MFQLNMCGSMYRTKQWRANRNQQPKLCQQLEKLYIFKKLTRSWHYPTFALHFLHVTHNLFMAWCISNVQYWIHDMLRLIFILWHMWFIPLLNSLFDCQHLATYTFKMWFIPLLNSVSQKAALFLKKCVRPCARQILTDLPAKSVISVHPFFCQTYDLVQHARLITSIFIHKLPDFLQY